MIRAIAAVLLAVAAFGADKPYLAVVEKIAGVVGFYTEDGRSLAQVKVGAFPHEAVLSRDGRLLASASWDHTTRVWPLAGGAPRVLEGHAQNVHGVAFRPGDGALVTAGYDASVRIWQPVAGSTPVIARLPAPLNAVTVAPDGEIIAAGADGKVYLLAATGELRGTVEVGATPIVAIAVARDGGLVAAAGIRGSVALIDRAAGEIKRTLIGPSLPVWSVAFLPDGHTLLTGGADRIIRRWNVQSGEPLEPIAAGATEDPLAAYAGDPGAEVFRACVACHTLKPNERNRAGPTLAGLFGRHIASLPGYNFSPALKRLDIVWTPETVAKLFELGPAAFTPGTKMPEQRLGLAADRRRLGTLDQVGHHLPGVGLLEIHRRVFERHLVLAFARVALVVLDK